jgi:hypothetical protein
VLRKVGFKMSRELIKNLRNYADIAEVADKPHWSDAMRKAAEYIKADIEKPLPEPMAFSVYADDEEFIYISKYKWACHDHINDAIDRGIDEAATWRVVPLYAEPPARNPLTDDDIEAVYDKWNLENHKLGSLDGMDSFARAIEAKIREQSKPQSNAI